MFRTSLEQPRTLRPGEVVPPVCIVYSVSREKHVILLVGRWWRLPLFLTIIQYVDFTSIWFPKNWLFIISPASLAWLGHSYWQVAIWILPKGALLIFWSRFPCWSKTVLAWWFLEHIPQPYDYPQDFFYLKVYLWVHIVYLVSFCLF